MGVKSVGGRCWSGLLSTSTCNSVCTTSISWPWLGSSTAGGGNRVSALAVASVLVRGGGPD